MKHSPITARRLRDGDTASGVPTDDLAALSLSELRSMRTTVLDGAVAMQSLDDLGSPEANEAAWLQCLELDKKLKAINAEITKRGEKP